MKAIILAAGIGYRLKPITNKVPKCLVEIANKPILGRAIENLIKAQIKDIVIVVGYKKDTIKNYIKKEFQSKANFYFIDNDIYDKTNNIYSLWLAKEHFNDDIILIESDIVFEYDILDRLLKSTYPNIIVVDKYNKYIDGTIVITDEMMNIKQLMTKEHQELLKDFSNVYKTVNIYKFSKQFLKNYFYPNLKTYIETQSYSKYYELILGIIIYLRSPQLTALNIAGLKWYEVDDYSDLIRADFLFHTTEKKLDILENSYGGFWNYSGFLDFVYMRNQYFPPESLIEDLKEKTKDLIKNFCSNQKILNKKLSIAFNLNPENTLVFNGSSQAIKFLLSFVDNFAIPVPTFQEYLNASKNSKIFKYKLDLYNPENFSLEDFVNFAIKNNAKNLIIVNPNNPIPFYINSETLNVYLSKYSKKFEFIIIDQSFIEFSENKLITEELAKKYENLVIVKSPGKSMGIAGLRIGFIYTKSKLIKEKYFNYIPIWNLNSFAEFFIELFYKYRKHYFNAIEKTIADTNNFYEKLKKIKEIEVIKPVANYIYFYIKDNFKNLITIKSLKKEFMDKYGIFIKDLSSKISIDYPEISSDKLNFGRIAVLLPTENDYFIYSLKMILNREQ